MELLVNNVGGEIIDGAYRGNKEIVKARVGGNIKRIGASAFEGCSSLKEIVIEEGVEYVGEYAFKDCGALEVLFIPKSLKRLKTMLLEFRLYQSSLLI